MTLTADTPAGLPRLSLLGGPLHALGRRFGLVRGSTNTVRLGLAIGAFLWLILLGLSLLEGLGREFFSLPLVGVHVRLLLALPLFFVCETILDPRLAVFVDTIVRSGIVPPASLPRLEAEITRVRRWIDSPTVDTVCLLLAAGGLFLGSWLALPGESAAVSPGRAIGSMPLAGLWYWGACMTLFRFGLLRWLVRLVLWAYFLARIAGMNLRLSPSHPDRAGGLGYLEVVHMHFLPLIFALSAVEAASFAEGIAGGTMAFEATYPIFLIGLALDALLFLGPLFIVAPLLWACRVRGLSDFSVLGAEYVFGFDRKWVQREQPPGEPLLGTADMQSLADLGNSANVVRDMRVVPMSIGMLRDFAIVALLPFAPLLLLKYPLAELTQKFISRLSGL